MSIESKVKFNHETAEKEVARASYAPGQHRFVVTGADRQMSKEKPEFQGVQYKMFKLNFKSLRDPDDVTSVVGRGMSTFQCLPFWDETWDELDYTVQTKDGEMHIQKYLERNIALFMESTRDLFSSLCPDEIPARPAKQEDGTYLFNGESRSADEYKECSTISKTAAGELAERLWNEGPEELIGKGCFGLVSYTEGNIFPELKRTSSEQIVDWKTKELIELVDPSRILAGRDETEEDDDEAASKSSKSNGAKGKPQASKSTIVAASKVKKSTSSKGARR